MLCKMISAISFLWWVGQRGWICLELGILLMLKTDAFIGSASIHFISRICMTDRVDQPLPSHLFHHLAWCSPSSNTKMYSTLHLFSQVHGSLGEVSCRCMEPSLCLNPQVWIPNPCTAPRNCQEVTFTLWLSCWKGAGGIGSRFEDSKESEELKKVTRWTLYFSRKNPQ